MAQLTQHTTLKKKWDKPPRVLEVYFFLYSRVKSLDSLITFAVPLIVFYIPQTHNVLINSTLYVFSGKTKELGRLCTLQTMDVF